MNYYKVSYSNYNFANVELAVMAETENDAIEQVKVHEENRRIEDVKSIKITKEQYFSYEQTTGRFEEIRF
jgi:hypothetical protein